jgi:hypothetical protein
MDQIYWITEYLKLLLAYGFTLYVWPSVVFRRYLRDKGRGFRFAFCSMVMVLLVNTVVLLLGLLHCLTPTVTTLMFHFTFLIQAARWLQGPLDRLMDWLKRSSRGTMSRRRLLLTLRQEAGRRLRKRFVAWRDGLRGRRLEFAILLLLLAFGTLYFSWGAFDEHSFGCGDQYVHHQWTYGLIEGKAFYSGIYPEGMHCMIYLVCTAFGLPLFNGILFFGGIHMHVILLSVYLLAREVFRRRGSALVALTLFLTLDQLYNVGTVGMTRLSLTLPMEYGFNGLFFCALYLIRYFRGVRSGRIPPYRRRDWKKRLFQPDLLLFGMGVAVTLVTHFYTTIIAVFVCIGVVPVYFRQLFRKGVLLCLVLSVLLGFWTAVLPMGVAYATGVPLQGSLYWAMGVMKNNSKETVDEDGLVPSSEPDQDSGTSGEASASGEDRGNDSAAGSQSHKTSLPERLSRFLTAFYRSSFNTLYPGTRGKLMAGAVLYAILAAALAGIIRLLRGRKKKSAAVTAGTGEEGVVPEGEAAPAPEKGFDGYLAAALGVLVLMLAYAASRLGLPSVIDSSRLFSPAHFLLMLLCVAPLDCLLLLLGRFLSPRLMALLTLVLCLGVYGFTRAAGVFHGYLFYQLTRYDAAVEATRQIIRTLPKFQYTIISTTEELYQVIESGYHEELITFLRKENQPNYTIPTPYLYLFIEKRPLYYAQYHFLTGPGWLADRESIGGFSLSYANQCPDIRAGEITPEYAEMPIKYGAKLSDSYSDLESRCIIESKAMRWLERFRAMYPQETQIIYEDDTFLCCRIVQNKDCLFSLGIMPKAAPAETDEGAGQAE